MTTKHTAATARIQRRLEQWELNHLRALAAQQDQEISDLQARLSSAERMADFWCESHHELEGHLLNDTEDARSIGLTQGGELLVIRTGALQ